MFDAILKATLFISRKVYHFALAYGICGESYEATCIHI